MCSNSAYLSKLGACVETRCTSRNSMHLQIFGALVETSMHLATIPQFKNGLKVHSESLSAPKISSCAANLWVHRIILNATEKSGRTGQLQSHRRCPGAPTFSGIPGNHKCTGSVSPMEPRAQRQPRNRRFNVSRGLNVSLDAAVSASAVGRSTSTVEPQVQRRPWAGQRRSWSRGVNVNRGAGDSTLTVEPQIQRRPRDIKEEVPPKKHLSQAT